MSRVRHLRTRSTVRPPQQPSRPRTARKRVSYKEESSEESDSQGSEEAKAKPIQPRCIPAPISQAPTPTKRKAAKPPVRPSPNSKRAKTAHTCRNTRAKENGEVACQPSGKPIPWATLPYQILVAIFDYASYPLVSETNIPLSSITWLLRTATCCKTFAEPALTVLYRSPPLTPPTRARALIEHLTSQDDQSINYRAKVKYLVVEASSTLLRKYAGHDVIDLGALVSLAPQLRGIYIYDLFDDPKYRAVTQMTKPSKRVYQRSLFAALQKEKTLLQAWTWNGRLTSSCSRLSELKEIHAMPAFQSLRDLSFVNYYPDQVNEGCNREDILAESIAMLPNLTDIHFRMSSIDARLLSLLPNSLQLLEIFDCSTIESSSLSQFLTSKGRHLKRLILDHNRSLNLSFLADLAKNCPKLELLKMNLRYFNTFHTVRSHEPGYDSLFMCDDVPTWPSTLQNLELLHLRKWSLKMAEVFFTSLVAAAKSFQKLRRLVIKASLDESGWRERVAFRDSWTQNLQRVFQRRSSPPNPCLRSISAYQNIKEQLSRTQKSDSRREHNRHTYLRHIETHKSTVVNVRSDSDASLINARTQTTIADGESDSDTPLINARTKAKHRDDSATSETKVRRSTRNASRRDDSHIVSGSSSNSPKRQRRRRRRQKGSDDSSSEDSALDDDGVDCAVKKESVIAETPLHIQGMCDIVDVLIDNLRPTDEKLDEDDFLDEEVSGDEDWNGDDNIDGEDGYAW